MKDTRKNEMVAGDGSKSFFFAIKPTEELKHVHVAVLDLPDSAHNALQRVGIRSMGDLIDHWDDMTTLPSNNPAMKTGVGVTTAKRIHAAAFSYFVNMNRDAGFRIVGTAKEVHGA